jgi:hypothetical protein
MIPAAIVDEQQPSFTKEIGQFLELRRRTIQVFQVED